MAKRQHIFNNTTTPVVHLAGDHWTDLSGNIYISDGITFNEMATVEYVDTIIANISGDTSVSAQIADLSGAIDTTIVDINYISGVVSGHTTSISGINSSLSNKVDNGSITGGDLTMNTNKILGRSTASVGAVQEISIGSGLSLVSGTLSATVIASSSFNETLVQPTTETSGIILFSELDNTVYSKMIIQIHRLDMSPILTKFIQFSADGVEWFTNSNSKYNDYDGTDSQHISKIGIPLMIADTSSHNQYDTWTKHSLSWVGGEPTGIIDTPSHITPFTAELWDKSDLSTHLTARLVATDTTIPSGVGTAVDGVMCSIGDAVILNSLTTVTDRGVYVAASGTWTRHPLFASGTFDRVIYITDGTQIGDVAEYSGTVGSGTSPVLTVNTRGISFLDQNVGGNLYFSSAAGIAGKAYFIGHTLPVGSMRPKFVRIICTSEIQAGAVFNLVTY